jgi:ferrochelatase
VNAERIGVLLINLGTPDSPSVGDVRKYLREFLMDPRVIDISAFGRWALVNLIVLPTRPRRSARAYASVWRKEGSPLLVEERGLLDALRKALGDRYAVELAMRYGSPSIASAWSELIASDVAKIIVVPLFPQYASASTGSALERVFEIAKTSWNVPPLDIIGEFYEAPGFITAFADIARPLIESFRPDHVLFSYHGLPERQVKKSDVSGTHCLASESCCASIGPENRHCYRAQCYATTRSLAQKLGLDVAKHSVSFQSRLGRTPWIKPYTDLVLPELRQRGVLRLMVMCPAFVADCLETVEEIGIRAKEQWKSLGGDDLLLVPSLNAHPSWVRALASMVEGHARTT